MSLWLSLWVYSTVLEYSPVYEFMVQFMIQSMSIWSSLWVYGPVYEFMVQSIDQPIRGQLLFVWARNYPHCIVLVSFKEWIQEWYRTNLSSQWNSNEFCIDLISDKILNHFWGKIDPFHILLLNRIMLQTIWSMTYLPAKYICTKNITFKVLILVFQVQDNPTRVDTVADVSSVNVELSKETLDTMLDGLSRIRDQLSSVANR